MKKRLTEGQIIGAVKRLEKDEPTREMSRELEVTMQTLYGWRRKFDDIEVSEAKRMRAKVLTGKEVSWRNVGIL